MSHAFSSYQHFRQEFKPAHSRQVDVSEACPASLAHRSAAGSSGRQSISGVCQKGPATIFSFIVGLCRYEARSPDIQAPMSWPASMGATVPGKIPTRAKTLSLANAAFTQARASSFKASFSCSLGRAGFCIEVLTLGTTGDIVSQRGRQLRRACLAKADLKGTENVSS